MPATASSPQPSLALYDWGPSPFCMKVRAVLELKGLAYRRIAVLTRIHELYQRSAVKKVPALDCDGTLLVDSTDIVHELERRWPEPRMVPQDPRERALCHMLEELCDESLYFFGLYYHWHDPPGRTRAQRFFARTFFGRLAFRPFLKRVEAQLRGHGISRKTPEHVRADLERNLQAFETWLDGRDYLLGAGPYLCDIALASQLRYLTLAAGTKTILTSYPRCAALVERLPQTRV